MLSENYIEETIASRSPLLNVLHLFSNDIKLSMELYKWAIASLRREKLIKVANINLDLDTENRIRKRINSTSTEKM